MVQTQHHYFLHNHSPCPESNSDPSSVCSSPDCLGVLISLGHLLANAHFNMQGATLGGKKSSETDPQACPRLPCILSHIAASIGLHPNSDFFYYLQAGGKLFTSKMWWTGDPKSQALLPVPSPTTDVALTSRLTAWRQASSCKYELLQPSSFWCPSHSSRDTILFQKCNDCSPQ